MNKVTYKTAEMKRRLAEMGHNAESLAKQIDGITAPTIKSILLTGKGHPEKVFILAKTLGFPVKRNDLSAILPARKSA